MFLVDESFLTSAHGVLGCITCHQGQNVQDKDDAHANMVKYPSRDHDANCASCHQQEVSNYSKSIHYTLKGIYHGILEYTNLETLEESPVLHEVFENDCYKCHASCGDCHVSRPKNFSPGLVNKHEFMKTPTMDQNCYGCHNARVAGEFKGEIGFGGDVHHEKGMDCMDCHPKENFHGDGTETYNMWAEDLPKCLDCHTDKDPSVATDVNHNIHGDKLSCQVCHAQAGQSCYECHLDYKDDGNLGSSSRKRIMFKIGLNTNITEDRPYKYVVLRHVPGQANMLDVVGDNLLPNYDQKANWKYSPNHNIQKNTFQNKSCEACHENTRIWLTEKDLVETDSAANKAVIPTLPESITGGK